MTLTRSLALALLISALGGRAAIAEELKIGVIAPTTGPAATVGSRQLASVQWWEHELNSTGGINGNKVRLIHCNDEGTPEHSVTCVRDLLSQHRPFCFSNCSLTGAIRATMPLVAQGPVMLTSRPGRGSGVRQALCSRHGPSDVNLTEVL